MISAERLGGGAITGSGRFMRRTAAAVRVLTLAVRDLHGLAAALARLQTAAAGDDAAAAADAKREVAAALEGLEGRLRCPGALRGPLFADVPLDAAVRLCRRRVDAAR